MTDGAIQNRREELYSLLGRLPARTAPVRCDILGERDMGGYVLQNLILTIDTTEAEPHCEPIPAFFARPKGAGPFPVILYNHSHGGCYEAGKEELLKPAPYMTHPGYADVLTGMGFCVFCIDHWCFGERSGRSESSVFKEMLWKGEYLWGRMIYDSLRALDYVCSRPDVDTERIGTLGMSMGSTMAWWLAALDERIKVCVDICCLTDYDALIAPRPHLGTVGMYDALTPPEGVDRIQREVEAVYRRHDAKDRFQILRYPVAHQETEEMRTAIVEFLKKYL